MLLSNDGLAQGPSRCCKTPGGTRRPGGEIETGPPGQGLPRWPVVLATHSQKAFRGDDSFTSHRQGSGWVALYNRLKSTDHQLCSPTRLVPRSPSPAPASENSSWDHFCSSRSRNCPRPVQKPQRAASLGESDLMVYKIN